VAFVAGEAGIGKTTLVERFGDEVRAAGLGRVASGQCIELHGPSEPYLPVLDLLGRLCRDDEGDEVLAAMERWAPSWLQQMPGVVTPARMEELRRRVPSPTRERMLRELADVFDVLARDQPLLVVLEDLHWSDESTVDLLAYVAGRSTPARLFLIGTYRPAEMVVHAHPMRATAQQLGARSRATELTLELLPPDDVRAYLEGRLSDGPVDPRLPEMVHERTDGNPLFLTSVVDHLLDRGLLALRDGAWQLASDGDEIPQSLRDLVLGQFEGLDAADRGVLTAAAVMGVDFDAIGVAAACDQPVETVEAICARLAEHGQLVCTTGTTSWPDGSLGGTYEFLHGLHRTVLYQHLAPAERARLHRALGERIETGYATDTAVVAAALASHFERGSDWARAVQHRLTAISAAKGRFADREVVLHCRAVLEILPNLPASAERDRLEMVCSLDLGVSLLAVRGYGTPEVEPLFVHARDLALRLELPQVEILARGGLFTFHVMHGNQRRAVELAGDLLAMADRFPISLFVMIGHTTLGCAHYNIGNVVEARDHFEQARAAWEPGFPRLQLDQKMLFLTIGTLVHHQLGDTAQADAWNAEAMAYAADLDDPLNVAHAYHLASEYRAMAGDRPRAIEWADRAIAVAAEHGFSMHEATSKVTKGFALGDLDLQLEGFATCTTTGQHVGEPMCRLGLARTHLDQGRAGEAAGELALAFAFVDDTGEARHLAELHRVRAECARREGRLEDAEDDLRRAIEVADAQQSRLFVLRAGADLAALLAETERAGEARSLLARLCDGFVPDGQGPELDRARALLATIG
jgi:tetratricopeptide (TPR) repeat protein